MVLPLLRPAVFAAAVLVFATSIDDFVVSSLLSSGASTETVPVKIYGSVRGGATPALNALATIMISLTILGAIAYEIKRRRDVAREEALNSAS